MAISSVFSINRNNNNNKYHNNRYFMYPSSSFSFLYSFNSIILLLLLLFISVTTTTTIAEAAVTYPLADNTPVHVLQITSLKTGRGKALDPIAAAYADALDVVVQHVNAKGGLSGRYPIEIIKEEAGLDVDKFNQFINKAVRDHNSTLLGVFGVLGENALRGILSNLEDKTLVAFSPFIGGSTDGFSKNVVHTKADSYLELLAMVTKLITHMQLRRVGIMYSIRRNFAEEKVEQAKKLLQDYDLSLAGTFVGDTYIDDSPDKTTWKFEDEWKKFISHDPQAVMVWGVPSPHTLRFMKMCLERLKDRKFVLVVSSTLIPTLYEMIKSLEGDPTKDYVNVTVLTTSIGPTAQSTRFEAAAKFREEFKTATNTRFTLQELLENDGQGSLMLSAWLGAKVMISALERLEGHFDRKSIMNSVFGAQLYSVNDFHFGIYSSNCSGIDGDITGKTPYFNAAEKKCRCNEGGHAIELFEVTGKGQLLPVTRLSTPLSVCSPKGLSLDKAIVVYRPIINEQLGKYLDTLNEVLELQIDYFTHDITFVPMKGRPSLEGVPANMSESHRELYGVQRNHFVSAISVGNVMLPLDPSITLPVILPISQLPLSYMLYGYQRNVIHLTALVDQQALTMCAYMFYKAKGRAITPQDRRDATEDNILHIPVKTLIMDTDIPGHGRSGPIGAAGFKHVADMSLNSFLIADSTMDYYEDLDEFVRFLETGKYEEGTYVFYVGIDSDPKQLIALNKFLKNNPTVRILIPFNNILLHYGAMQKYIPDADQQAQVLFTTSTPHWNPQGDEEVPPSVASFYKLTENATHQRTPLSLLSFIGARFLQSVASQINTKITGDAILRQIYSLSLVAVDSTMSFGPYYDTPCHAAEGGRPSIEQQETERCEKNFPSSPIYVRTLSAATGQRVVPLSQDFVNRDVVVRYSPLPKDPPVLEKWQLAVIIAAAILFCVIIATIIIVMCVLLKKNTRDTRNAPRNPHLPFTLVFTDIQRSTSLWAEIPEEMGPMLEIHHTLIRSLIKKYNGYEVKTIGDAFMIAFKRASDALALAYQLQFDFFQYNWSCPDLDECYREFELQFIDEHQDDDTAINALANLTCNLSPEAYEQSWCGIRVRIGIHTGFGDIKCDPVTHGYDYYGTIANIAARTESAAYGGQVVVTEATRRAAEEEGPLPAEYKWLEFGPQPLRGVPEPVYLSQLHTVPGRVFGPLRLEVPPVTTDLDNDDSTTNTATVTAREDELLIGITYTVITTLFSTMGSTIRRKEYQQLLKLWRLKTSRTAIQNNRFIPHTMRNSTVRPSMNLNDTQTNNNNNTGQQQGSVAHTSGGNNTSTMGGSRINNNINRSNSMHQRSNSPGSAGGQQQPQRQASGVISRHHQKNNSSTMDPPSLSIQPGTDDPQGTSQMGTLISNNNIINSEREERRRKQLIADDKFVGALAKKIASVAMKRLPGNVARLLIHASLADHRASRNDNNNNNNNNNNNIDAVEKWMVESVNTIKTTRSQRGKSKLSVVDGGSADGSIMSCDGPGSVVEQRNATESILNPKV